MTNVWCGPEMASYHKLKETHNSNAIIQSCFAQLLPKLKKNCYRATKSIYFSLKLIVVEQNRLKVK